MNVNVKRIDGVWKLGYSLDKHTTSSTPIGYNQYGHIQFDTVRSEAGEALFQLKYRSDFSQVSVIAQQLNESLGNFFHPVNWSSRCQLQNKEFVNQLPRLPEN